MKVLLKMAMDKLDEVIIRQVVNKTLVAESSISGPTEAVELIKNTFGDMDRELFIIINLNTKNKPLNFNIVAMGTLDAAIIHPREVLKSAILSNAASIVAMHNHPSGNLIPSEADMELTGRLSLCSDLVGINFLDHVIFNQEDYYSMRAQQRNTCFLQVDGSENMNQYENLIRKSRSL